MFSLDFVLWMQDGLTKSLVVDVLFSSLLKGREVHGPGNGTLEGLVVHETSYSLHELDFLHHGLLVHVIPKVEAFDSVVSSDEGKCVKTLGWLAGEATVDDYG